MPVITNLNLANLSGIVESAAPLLAYLDPGTGSVVLQVIVAGFLSAAALFKYFWQTLISLFRFGRRTASICDEHSPETTVQSSEDEDGRKAA